MPRGKEPSWAMKTAIWDLASKLGPKPEVILRDLEKLCRHDKPLEGELPPDPRTVRRVIEELQTLKADILATLPRRIWKLRRDYNAIRDELERGGQEMKRKEVVVAGKVFDLGLREYH